MARPVCTRKLSAPRRSGRAFAEVNERASFQDLPGSIRNAFGAFVLPAVGAWQLLAVVRCHGAIRRGALVFWPSLVSARWWDCAVARCSYDSWRHPSRKGFPPEDAAYEGSMDR